MTARNPIKRSKTARELSELTGKSERTIRHYFAQPRADYEAQSLARTKPWESEGVSRATWYRRQKKHAAD